MQSDNSYERTWCLSIIVPEFMLLIVRISSSIRIRISSSIRIMSACKTALRWRLYGKQPAGKLFGGNQSGSQSSRRGQASRKRPSAKHVAAATAPKARSAYALFLAAKSKELPGKLSQSARRAWVSEITKQWNSMGAEQKEAWQKQSAREFAERRSHIGLAMDKLDDHHLPLADDRGFGDSGTKTQFGQLVLVGPDTLRSPSHTCTHYLFERNELKYRASGKIYSDFATCEMELLVHSCLPVCGQFSAVLANSKDQLPWAIFDHVFEDLAIALQRRPLTPEEQLAMIKQVGHGLERLHECGWAHANLKPSAVLWDGSRMRAVLTEFQLACRLQPDGRKDNQYRYAGAYRAPEHWAWSEAWKDDSLRATPASDVWALACTLAEAATAAKLFTEVCSIQSFCASQSRPLASHTRSSGPWKVLLQLKTSFQAVLLEMLHKDPQRRMTLPTLLQRLR